jgi:DUF4097 and DUF4098 domain-containing protein YvlB
MNTRDNDVVVDFTVRVPAGVRFVARTVNGAMDARSLQSDVDVRTVNGRIDLSTTGIGAAETVNGSIDATIGTAILTAPVHIRTVNGSIDLTLPFGMNANLKAETINGRFESEVPVTVRTSQGRGKRITGTIGNGGRDLELHTVNGSIRLRRAAR